MAQGVGGKLKLIPDLLWDSIKHGVKLIVSIRLALNAVKVQLGGYEFLDTTKFDLDRI